MADYTTANDLDLDAICARYGISDPMPLEPVPGGAANSRTRCSTSAWQSSASEWSTAGCARTG
ncbi:hypothetical protein ACFVAV_23580 [Nocardia sp. NPDC057663]|uniref:hypothetical protein n=1 Tax=Nocardia sp. NPDC057663 TaxID=3346201 RepID=UPI00366B0427